MIMGLSHIAMATDTVEAATARLSALGYAPRFDLPGLENHAAKARYLTHHQPTHHIRALAAEGAMAIELLDHGALAGPQTAALLPVFRSPAPLPGWRPVAWQDLPIAPDRDDRLAAALGAGLAAFHDPVLGMTLLWVPGTNQQPTGLIACVLPCDDQTAMAGLLKHLRFRRGGDPGLWSLLTPVASLQAHLLPVAARAHSGWTSEPLLDAPGCACLAFMARRTQTTALPLALQGDSVSFTLAINETPSRITMARPANGPIIEMVDPQT